MAMAFPADNALLMYLTHSRGGSHRSSFWNRLAMSGILNYPGSGINGGPMVWASEWNGAEIELLGDERVRYEGTFSISGREDRTPNVFQVWEEGGRLHLRHGRPGAKADSRFHLVPLGKDRFSPGRYADDGLQAIDLHHGLRFVRDGNAVNELEITKGEQILVSAQRTQ